MPAKLLDPVHPGEILKEEYLQPLELTQEKFAAHIGVPVQRVNQIARGRRAVSPATALLFAQALNTTAEFWLGLQAQFDLATARPTRKVRVLPGIKKRMP